MKPQLIEQAKNYSKPQIYEIIETIAEYDREIKSGEIKLDFQKEAVKDLCRKITAIGK
jgi:DNA polymerase III delta subunit